MRRILSSLAVLILGAVMTTYGYAQATGCCMGHCGCGENATCTKSGHCDEGCKDKNCCGKTCAKGCCEGMSASKDGAKDGKDCAGMCAQMHGDKAPAAPAKN